ncbi:MAG: AAA family ATPase [Patescibacteria group bacterium]|nr:AAA family ATPase [Patescibacteria group bacterium]MCL5224019.1 AAA family ATPase [Patescibacteria group bacterium]
MAGYDRLWGTFVEKADNHSLFHGYIFFGEQGVGKFTFANCLANYLEFDRMDKQDTPRSETLMVSVGNGKESIGIDTIRDIKYFLSEQPSASAYRTVLIDGADNLTDQAQNALLKVSEEPPAHGLLILITNDLDNLLPTLQSRFHKIYFPRLSKNEIAKHLESILKLDKEAAEKIAKISFGKMGRALQLAAGDELDARQKARKALKDRLAARKLLADAVDDPEQLNAIIKELLAELALNPQQNLTTIKELLRRNTLNNSLNTNKRLQLEAALWTI